MRRSLFWRVFSAFALAVLVFAALALILQYALSERRDPSWVEAVDSAVEAHEAALQAGRAEAQRELAALSDELDLRLALRDASGELVAGDPGVRPLRNLRPRQAERLARGAPVVLRDKSGHVALVLAIGPDLRLVAESEPRGQRRTRWLILGGALLLALVGLTAFLLARSLTRRLALLEHGAARIARGELDHRVALGGPGGDEIDRLGEAMNDMARQLGELLRGQRSLLTNVSHELKTPLARLRVLAELLAERAAALPEPDHPGSARMRQGAAELERDVREIDLLVQDLLTSGRLELAGPHAPALRRSEVELGPLLAPLAEAHGAALAVEPQGLALSADPVLLGRLLGNLLSNARRACPDGHVMIHAARREELVEIAVEDEGPGIPPAERTRVFEAFYRLDDARARDHGGTGLGLYLCAQIARAHGGTIAAEDRLGGVPGARLVVRVPAVV